MRPQIGAFICLILGLTFLYLGMFAFVGIDSVFGYVFSGLFGLCGLLFILLVKLQEKTRRERIRAITEANKIVNESIRRHRKLMRNNIIRRVRRARERRIYQKTY